LGAESSGINGVHLLKLSLTKHFLLLVSLQHYQYLDNTLSSGTVTDNNQLQTIWKEAVMAN
jgi:hypothetical protein